MQALLSIDRKGPGVCTGYSAGTWDDAPRIHRVRDDSKAREPHGFWRTHSARQYVLNLAFDAPESTTLPQGSDTPQGNGDVNWQDLVERIRMGDEAGMDELYRLFSRGVRYYICRHLGPQDIDDRVHDTFIVVVEAVKKGELREPDRLMAFVRTVVRRVVATNINRAIQQRREMADQISEITADRRLSPEESAITRQNEQIAMRVLRSVSSRDREILTRFYLLEERPEQICQSMELTENQFRLLKSRALQRFIQIGKRQMHRKALLSRAS